MTGLGSGGASQAWSWLQSLGTVAGLIAWATLSFAYIRYHAAMKAQGISRDTLPWKSPFQPYTAWVGFIGSTIASLLSSRTNAADFRITALCVVPNRCVDYPSVRLLGFPQRPMGSFDLYRVVHQHPHFHHPYPCLEVYSRDKGWGFLLFQRIIL